MRPASTISRVWNLSPAALADVRREFETAIDSASHAAGHTSSHRFPLSIWESEDKLVLEVEAPGVDPSDLEVTVEDGILRITGKRQRPERDGELKHSESRFGEFSRSVRLHESLDPTSVSAELNNGVLTVDVSRRTESLPRRVPVALRSRSENVEAAHGGETTDETSNESKA